MRGRRPINSWISLSLCAAAVSAGAVSCQSLSGTTVTAVPSGLPAITLEPQQTAVPTPSAEISTLTLWLPPAFRSDSNSPGGNVLNKRIEAFEALHPGISVVVRVKAATGAGGLRDSLAAAAAAAPGALPDLVALDQSNLRAAAIKGLIVPLDGLFPSQEWDSFFPYAKAMVVIDDRHYGLPFAGDAIVIASTVIPYAEPQRWQETSSWTSPIILPLGDSRALFLFFGYYAAGATPMLSITDAKIEPQPLEQELAWLRRLQESGTLSPRSLQIDSFESSFLAIENIGESSATLFSIVLKSKDYFLGPLPTPEGEMFSLATGWAWVIATPDPDRRIKAAELMAWLSNPQFLAEWTEAQGVLPPSRAALEGWVSSAHQKLIEGISETTLPFPDDEISAFAGPAFSKAARRVLLEGILPADAALEAAKAVNP
jgi:ABC-type glycerol-3-phosphate transport system substrate-binding protein